MAKYERDLHKQERVPKSEKLPKRGWFVALMVAIPVVIIGAVVGVMFAFAGQESYKITVFQSNGGEIVTNSTGESFVAGSNITYTITPDDGYKISAILVDDESVTVTAAAGESQTYTFTNLQKDHTLEAVFTINTFGITVTQSANGTITPSTVSKKSGESQTFTITPSTGYEIATITVDGAIVPVTAASGAAQTYTFTNIQTTHSITATFAIRTFGINVTQSANGTITPSTVSKKSGESQTFTITPSTGYEIATITVDGASVPVTAASGDSQIYTFNNVQTTHTITATFAIRTFGINVTQSANGTITPATAVKNYGDSQTFTITPNIGYEIATITVDGASVAVTADQGDSQIYTFNNVQTTHTITATFVLRSFGIGVTQTSNGTISPSSSAVNYGSNQTFTITPDEGYEIVAISVDGSSVAVTVNPGKSQSYTFTNVTATHTITATFVVRTFLVRFEDGSGNEIVTRTVEYGQDATPPADPEKTGYTFSNWLGSYTDVTGDKTIVAAYSINTFGIAVNAGANGTITPNNPTVDYGSDQTFTITPDLGYEIEAIYIDESAVTIEITVPSGNSQTYTFENVTESHQIDATFRIRTFDIGVTQTSNGTISPNGPTVTVNYGSTPKFTITPSTGYEISTITVDGVSVPVTALSGNPQEYTFTSVTSNRTITATFVLRSFGIGVTQTSNGTISPSSSAVNYGSNQTFTITPDEGYEIETISVDGSSVAVTVNPGKSQSYTFTNVTATHTITAIFKLSWEQTDVTGQAGYIGTASNATELEVPSTLGGETITSVDVSSIPDSVESLILPETFATFTAGEFSGLSNLTAITVDEGNSTYGSSDGALYTKDLETLVAVPAAKDSIAFATSITIIGELAFENSTLLQVVVPSTVQTISSNAFKKSSIATLSLTSETTTLSADALSEMSELTEIIVVEDLANSYALPNDGVYTYEWTLGGSTVESIQSSGTYMQGATPTGYAQTQSTADGWTTTLSEEKYYITGVPSGTGTLLIPAQLSVSETVVDIYGIGKGSVLTNITSYSQVIFEEGSLLTSIESWAFSGCSNLTSITIPSGVTNIGRCAFQTCSNLASINIPDSVISIGSTAFSGTAWLNAQADGVVYAGKVAYGYRGTMPAGTSITLLDGTKGIAYYAFYNNSSSRSNLISISIPSSIILIGDYAFKDYINLISVTFTGESQLTSIGSSTFYGCSSLTSITIPSTVSSIGPLAFSYCSSLTSITIPNSVTSIGGYAFSYCSNLISVTFASGSKLTSIGLEAFRDCSKLTSVIIPDSVINLQQNSFKGCTSLESITIPSLEALGGPFHYLFGDDSSFVPASLNSVIINGGNRIPGWAFYGSTNLTSIIIPDSVTSIGVNAFYGTGWLNSQSDGVVYAGKVAYIYKGTMPTNTSIELLEGTKGIADFAFPSKYNLISITIPSSVTSIGYSAFMSCSGLTSIIIPSSVTSIGYEAFYGTAWLNAQADGVVYAGKVAYIYKGIMPADTSITLIEGTKGIAGSAFSSQTNLISITIPNSVTSIGYGAFRSCSGLTSIIIPSSVTSIEYEAFYGCGNLATITIESTTLVSYSSNLFNDCYDLTAIYVPSDLVDTYKVASGWSGFASKIFAIV